MELRLEFCAIVGLDHVHPKWQPPEDFVDELNRGALGAGVEHLENANPRAVINGRELKQPSPSAGDPLEELHVNLKAMPWRDLLVPLPASAVRPMLLIGRQATHAVACQDAMDRGSCDPDLVKSVEVRRDACRAKMILLA